MNRDELAALSSLMRSLGWKILCAEFQRMREEAVRLAMNPDTPADQVDRIRRFQAGVEDVLGWPGRILQVQQPAEEVVRAGIMQGPPEEE